MCVEVGARIGRMRGRAPRVVVAETGQQRRRQQRRAGQSTTSAAVIIIEKQMRVALPASLYVTIKMPRRSPPPPLFGEREK